MPVFNFIPVDREGKLKRLHWNELLPLLLFSETSDLMNGQILTVDAHCDSKYNSKAELDKDAAANTVVVAYATVNLNMQK